MNLITTDKPFSVFALEADRDYLLARLINFSGIGFASRAAYFGQQAIEKYFKALIVDHEKQYLKTHNLIFLSEYCSKYDTLFAKNDFLHKIKIFDDFREVGRYGAESTYDPHSKRETGFTTAGMYSWEAKNILVLDEIVNTIRKKLDFKKIGFSNSLKEIANDGETDYLALEWKLPIKLRDILVTENNFFK